MVLVLENAAGSNFIKDFVAQHSNNSDKIDAFAGPCLITHPLQTWTPIIGADGGAPVLGTGGYSRGLFYRIFDQVYVHGEFRFGSSGASFGSGVININLPVPAESISIIGVNAAYIGEMPVIGNANMWDASASNGQPFSVHLRSSNNIIFGTKFNVTSAAVTATLPVAFAASDGISWSIKYKAAT